MTNKGRRSKDDIEWSRLREVLRKRDKYCRLTECLTIRESKLIKEVGGRLDCAHLFSAANYPELIYEKRNVYRINSTSHRMLDEFKDPVTGEFLDRNKHQWWWWRVSRKTTEPYDPETNYEELNLEYVKGKDN